MGTRDKEKTLAVAEPNQMTGQTFSDWYKENQGIKLSNYNSSADDADIIINATSGYGSIPALEAVGREKLAGKVLLDIANPLDFSNGMPPTMFIVNDDSLGEKIQREFPEVKVVKGLNTMNAHVMVNPSLVPGDHNVFICGNDTSAKEEVNSLLTSMGWPNSSIIDLGGISNSRGTEQLVSIWVRLWGALGTAEFNFHIAKK
jgi:predicted dinucleotide-binding enzyme